MRFGLGVVGSLEFECGNAELDPFTASDAALSWDTRWGEKLTVEIEYPSRIDHLTAMRGYSQERAAGEISRRLSMLSSYSNDYDDGTDLDGKGALLDEDLSLKTAHSRFICVCLANAYAEHGHLPSTTQLCGIDATLHALLSKQFDVTIALLDMPVNEFSGKFEFVAADGTLIDQHGDESPLITPYWEEMVTDDNGNDYLHPGGGELVCEQCIAGELQRKGLRVVFDNLPAAMKETEEYGDDEMLC